MCVGGGRGTEKPDRWQPRQGEENPNSRLTLYFGVFFWMKQAVHYGDGHCAVPPEIRRAKVIGVLCLAARALERISR